MTGDPAPIAYTALQPGTPVQSSDGHQFGTVEAVLVVKEVDVFDGIVVETPAGTRFVDASHIVSMFTSYVRTTLSAADADNLPLPEDTPVFRVDARNDAGASVADSLGRLLGRVKWKREQ